MSSRCKAGLTVIPNLSASFSPQLQTVPAWISQCLILLTKQFLRFTYFHPSGVINSTKTHEELCKAANAVLSPGYCSSGWSQCAHTSVSCRDSHAARGTASFLHGHGVWDFYKKALGWGCSTAELLQRNGSNTTAPQVQHKRIFCCPKAPKRPICCSGTGSNLVLLQRFPPTGPVCSPWSTRFKWISHRWCAWCYSVCKFRAP